jgi:predicted hydrolase (HD superfamily)
MDAVSDNQKISLCKLKTVILNGAFDSRHLNFIRGHFNMEQNYISREEAWKLLRKYNQDPFHLQHALTVESVMKWYAQESGFGEDAEYWGIVGLLHDIDFEKYPEQHCIKAPELLREGGVQESIIHAVCSHGYGITVDIKPEHQMEKILFAADELTGLIWAAALMRPSKSTKDMELKSLKKKYKSKGFAAGCSRAVIEQGAQMLGWELDELLSKTLEAMKYSEDIINEEMKEL